jgi:hypothetical protein
MTKPKFREDVANEDFRQGLDKPAKLPVDTDDNDKPSADATGDSDDETADENLAVPDGADEEE